MKGRMSLSGTPRDRLIFALDVDRLDEAEPMVRKLAPHVGVFKVGPRLFTNAGSLVFDLIHGMGSKVFLDLKFHDIPEAVAAAAREISRQRVKMFTLHALGGPKMIRAVQQRLMESTIVPGLEPPLCLAVTLLTSHTPEDIKQLGFPGPLVQHVTQLARSAVEAGAGGVVASGHEVGALKRVLPTRTVFVVPGIRRASDPVGDQSRVMSAEEAIRAGADYLVVGRPIRDAPDPAAVADAIVDEIARGLEAFQA
ncbi:MAG: orotidine-5'-phosphate decarboxylase [Myxococcota bacterium]